MAKKTCPQCGEVVETEIRAKKERCPLCGYTFKTVTQLANSANQKQREELKKQVQAEKPKTPNAKEMIAGKTKKTVIPISGNGASFATVTKQNAAKLAEMQHEAAMKSSNSLRDMIEKKEEEEKLETIPVEKAVSPISTPAMEVKGKPAVIAENEIEPTVSEQISEPEPVPTPQATDIPSFTTLEEPELEPEPTPIIEEDAQAEEKAFTFDELREQIKQAQVVQTEAAPKQTVVNPVAHKSVTTPPPTDIEASSIVSDGVVEEPDAPQSPPVPQIEPEKEKVESKPKKVKEPKSGANKTKPLTSAERLAEKVKKREEKEKAKEETFVDVGYDFNHDGFYDDTVPEQPDAGGIFDKRMLLNILIMGGAFIIMVIVMMYVVS